MENFLEINYEKNMKMLSLASVYCEEKLSHQDIINELYNDNDLKKQLCLINLQEINSQKEADILVYNLTQHSGPIRETASYAILKLIKQNDFKNFFQTRNILDTFVNAITDINPSVSRNMVQTIYYVDDSQYLYEKIIKEIQNTLNERNSIRKNRSYEANKKNFNLYWNLEALISISNKIMPDNRLTEILNITAESDDYTIREKTAKSASMFIGKSPELIGVLEVLKQDTNIYVRLNCL